MNEHKRRSEAAQAEIKKFLTALSAGQAAPVDRFNRKIEVGQKILLSTPVDLVFDVVGIAPVLDPQAPPGLINVQVTVTVPITCQANRPAQNVVIIGEGQPQAAADPVKERTDHVEVSRPTLVLTDQDRGPEAESPADVQADGADPDPSPDPRD